MGSAPWFADALELAKAVLDFVENEAPAEWDGGSLGYSLGGLAGMATDLIEGAKQETETK